MHSTHDDDPPAPHRGPDSAHGAHQPALPTTARSSTARAVPGRCEADRIGHAHQWIVRSDLTPLPVASEPAPPKAAPRMAAVTPSAPQWPPRRRDPSSSFYVGHDGQRVEESSPFAGFAIDRGSRPAAAGAQPANYPIAHGGTQPGTGPRTPASPPATGYRTPVSDGVVSSALAGLPIQRPRVHNPHGTGGTPVVGPTSHAGADPSAAVLALPEIPAYATPVHPAHADAQLAFEALFSGELSPGDAAHVAARMWRYTVPAGQPLFAADEPAESAFVVATGLGRIEVSGPFGPMALIPLRSGDLVGLAALTGDATNGHAAVAASDLVVFALRRDEFHKLCAEAPHLAQRLLAAGLVQASRRIRALAERMTQYAQLDTADPAAPAVAPAESRGSRLGRFLARLKDPKENG